MGPAHAPAPGATEGEGEGGRRRELAHQAGSTPCSLSCAAERCEKGDDMVSKYAMAPSFSGQYPC